MKKSKKTAPKGSESTDRDKAKVGSVQQRLLGRMGFQFVGLVSAGNGVLWRHSMTGVMIAYAVDDVPTYNDVVCRVVDAAERVATNRTVLLVAGSAKTDLARRMCRVPVEPGDV